ncbi:hypothetical protein Tco_0503576 [Tanacetum coccineum]
MMIRHPRLGTERGSQRRRSGKEPELPVLHSEKTNYMTAEDYYRHGNKSVLLIMNTDQPWLAILARDRPSSLQSHNRKIGLDQPVGRQYLMICEVPLALVPNSQGRHVIQFHHFINNDLESLRGGESSHKYSTLGISHWGKKRRQFYAFATTRESAHDIYSKRRIIAVTKVEIVEWQNYKHLDWITVRRDDDILYKFKEGDFHRLRIQDIEDNVQESVVIQRRVEDLQLGVESYQKKLNLTKPDTYRSNLRRRDAYTPYSNPRGFIYENKDKKNRLMRIDELHKFSDDTLDDVRTALNDRLKGIKMEYLPQTF